MEPLQSLKLRGRYIGSIHDWAETIAGHHLDWKHTPNHRIKASFGMDFYDSMWSSINQSTITNRFLFVIMPDELLK